MIDKTAIEKAARNVLADWDSRSYGEQEKLIKSEYGTFWSPSGRMMSSKVMHELREALAAIEAEKPSEDTDTTRAFQSLEMYGVTRGRAITISHGIDILAQRYRKDCNGFEAEKLLFAESYHAEQCKACKK